MTDNAPRVLLLGAGEPGWELAVALQHLGAEVIVADGHREAPAHRVADQSLVVNLTDADELAAVFARLHPDFVVTLTEAVAVDALDTVSAVPSARSLRLTIDREGLRRLAADQLGLPTAPFWFVESLADLAAVAAHAGFPLLVKPVARAPGRGQSVVAGPDGLERAWRHAAGQEPAGTRQRVWAETVVEVEFLVTLIVVCSQCPIGPVIEFCAPIAHRDADGGDLESWQPLRLTTAALDAAKSIAARIVKALGGRGVFSVELMVNGDEVYFADVSALPTERAWVTLRTQRLSVFELQARAILGLAVDTLMVSPGAARMLSPGRDSAPTAEALTAALGVPESDVRMFDRGGPGAPAGTTGRLGVALATAADVATARDRAHDVAARLNMRDSRG
ncbi:phosphoribosylglycinamide formyltransferase 2 [Mycobacterium shinjukuense]|uniref:Phosphoribosylglycinamide formyltransferase 2 n=1 Tax=Mycobacterium shinjukuense TaxID=398694 RepID=A0A7I7MSF2_9MYCO|nr:formate-dependent phosphoribosylglycinamide formyltransferase [Mycobacterium shinjukuense]BBX75161.1 phosphoribosylglycinamide formyltransferase 2 [Mycobacterium shinjukuense]